MWSETGPDYLTLCFSALTHILFCFFGWLKCLLNPVSGCCPLESECFGYDIARSLTRTRADSGEAGIAVVALHGKLGAISVAACHLNVQVSYTFVGFSRIELKGSGLDTPCLPLGDEPSKAVGLKSSCIRESVYLSKYILTA
jgi:hypothetical protein